MNKAGCLSGLDHGVSYLAAVMSWWVSIGSGMLSPGWVTTGRTTCRQAEGWRQGRWGRRAVGGAHGTRADGCGGAAVDRAPRRRRSEGEPIPLCRGHSVEKCTHLSSASRACAGRSWPMVTCVVLWIRQKMSLTPARYPM